MKEQDAAEDIQWLKKKMTNIDALDLFYESKFPFSG